MRLFQRSIAMCLVGTMAAVVRPDGALAQSVQQVPPRSNAETSSSTLGATSLTLAQALERALTNNPGLRSAEREIEAAEGAIDQGGAIPNPALSYEMEDTRKETRTNTLMLTQPLELGGKRAARISAAERGRDVAQAQLATKRAEVRGQTHDAWREVLAAQEGQRLAEDATKLAQRATQAAARRVQAGSASPLEETRARLEELNARLAQAQAESTLAASRTRLAALWGQPQADFARVEGRLDDLPGVPSAEALLDRLDETPAMRVATHESARSQALTDIERSRRYPDVNVSVGVKRATELGRNQTILGLSLPLPLFDSNRGNLREALARNAQAQDALQATRSTLTSELLQARNRLTASRMEAEGLAREVVPAAQSALDAATRGYELGKFGLIDLLDAQRSLFQMKTQQLRAWLDTHKAAAEIARLLGDAADSLPPTPTSAR